MVNLFKRRGAPDLRAPLQARRVAWGLLAVVLVMACFIAGDYGVAWDDAVQTQYGALVLDYFASCGRNCACNQLSDLRFYGAPVELVGAALGRVFPGRLVELRHLLTAAIAILSIPALYRFGHLLGRPWLGVCAATLLWLTPRFFGHAFINTKDTPFAVGMIATVGALTALLAHRRYTWHEMIQCGLLMGCTVAVRPGGWLVIGPLYLLGVSFADWQARRLRSHWGAQADRNSRRTVGKQAALFLLAWAVMLICWPWVHQSPFWHPLEAIRISSSFHLAVPVLFDGEIVMSDGLRHFLFLLPAIAVFAALGIDTLWARFPRRGVRLALGMLVVWLALSPLRAIIELHPYQIAYFNEWVGGTAGAAGQYETEYWLTSYREAMQWIRNQVDGDGDSPVRVLVAANEHSKWCAEYYATEAIEISTTVQGGQPGDLPPGIT